MRDPDDMIDEALDAEERELLRSIGEEPAYLTQALGLFRGRNAWINVILMIVQGAGFVAGVWAAWNFFSADEALTALRWGLPAATLLLMSLSIKFALGTIVQTDRILRELKRIDLQLARGVKG